MMLPFFVFSLYVTKQLGEIALDHHQRRWTRRINEPLAGKTLGILGLGAIGAEVARKAAALEMRVIGTRREPRAVPMVDRVWGPPGTADVLARADFVLLLLPSTTETRPASISSPAAPGFTSTQMW